MSKPRTPEWQAAHDAVTAAAGAVMGIETMDVATCNQRNLAHGYLDHARSYLVGSLMEGYALALLAPRFTLRAIEGAAEAVRGLQERHLSGRPRSEVLATIARAREQVLALWPGGSALESTGEPPTTGA